MSAPRPSHLEYRPDIDGLRAVAVSSVLVYHAFPAALPGGFVGVDIFFVISGFLISRIILRQLEDHTFTFANFYERRIRRIFPALALVLLATLVFGWWVLLPMAFEDLGIQVAAGAGFASNLLLWAQSGDYFDSAAELKPLLHLWSLGVEEQYYLLWPLLLFLFRGDRQHRIFWLILGLAVASFAINVHSVARAPSAAFYLPQSRFWELMLGGIIAYADVHDPAWVAAVRRRRPAWLPGLAAAAGAALLLAGLVLIEENHGFPGARALLPTSGTALLIAAGPEPWLQRRVLASRVFVFVGLISYPLYLWHWPLLVYARVLHGGAPPASTRIALLTGAVALASATYALVERRIRHLRPLRLPRSVVVGLASSVGALAVCGAVIYGSHAGSRSSHVPFLPEIAAAYDDWAFRGNRTIVGDTERAVLFVGDSHMQQYLPRIDKLARQHRAPLRTLIFDTEGGCAPVPGLERIGHECNAFVEHAFATARHPEVEIVIFAASWPGFIARDDYYAVGDPDRRLLDLHGPAGRRALQRFEAALADLVAPGKRVYLVLSSPRGKPFDPRSMVKRVGLNFEVHIGAPVPRKEVAAATAAIDARLADIAARVGAQVIDPKDYLCDAFVCQVADETGRPLYKDESHVRASTARERFTAFDRFVYAE
ncbi:MAG TPA: acyltransferase family protein [Gammaproteobacteria bacterium]